jgi:hypothetical protein
MTNERAKQIPAEGTQPASAPCWRNVEEFHRELPVSFYLSRSCPCLEQQLERRIAPSSVRSWAPSQGTRWRSIWLSRRREHGERNQFVSSFQEGRTNNSGPHTTPIRNGLLTSSQLELALTSYSVPMSLRWSLQLVRPSYFPQQPLRSHH